MHLNFDPEIQTTMRTKPSRKSPLQNQSDAVAMRLFTGLALFLMACSGVFGQTQNQIPPQVQPVEISISETNQVHMMLWFMGAKQHLPATNKEVQPGTSIRKQLIEAGATPNRILRQTLLKKAMNHDNALA